MVNPALVFGRARPGENTREIAEKIKAEKLPGIPRGGTAVVGARAVATGLRLAMLNGRTGERYFLGAENLSWASIITTLAGAIGVAPPARHVNPSLAMAIAVASEAVALVTRSHPLVSRETVRIANRTYRYSNRKATRELGWNHRSFAETAAYVAGSRTRSGHVLFHALRAVEPLLRRDRIQRKRTLTAFENGPVQHLALTMLLAAGMAGDGARYLRRHVSGDDPAIVADVSCETLESSPYRARLVTRVIISRQPFEQRNRHVVECKVQSLHWLPR